MKTSSLRKTAVVVAVAGTIAASSMPQAEANVVNFSWAGAFTMLGPTGSPVANNPSDYASGYYANGDFSNSNYGAPYFPGNVGSGATPSPYYSGAINTAHGWYGARTPISGTMAFDTSTGAGVGTINPFFFFGDTPGSGPGTNVVRALSMTLQSIDTIGTIVGTMQFSWNDTSDYVSIVLDGSGLSVSLPAMIASGPTSTVFGVGALPATDGIDFNPSPSTLLHPLGSSPVATTTINTGIGCDTLTLATQVNAYTITTNMANLGTCTTGMADDGIGGDPLTSAAFSGFNANFDITSFHFDSFVPTPVPVPAAVWLFGSGLAGLAAVVRRKRRA